MTEGLWELFSDLDEGGDERPGHLREASPLKSNKVIKVSSLCHRITDAVIHQSVSTSNVRPKTWRQ